MFEIVTREKSNLKQNKKQRLENRIQYQTNRISIKRKKMYHRERTQEKLQKMKDVSTLKGPTECPAQ